MVFLQHNSGVTFRLQSDSGERYLLKLHLMINGEISAPPQTISARIAWLAGLKEKTGIIIQTPIKNQENLWITQIQEDSFPEEISCTVQEWVEGEPPHGDLTTEQLFRLGQLMAQLHQYSSHWKNQDAFIPSYEPFMLNSNLQALRGSIGLGILTEAEFAQIELASHAILTFMNNLQHDHNQWGLIHGDLHYDNVLVYGNELRVIDFDGMISAPFAYDIGATLYQIGYQGLPAREDFFAGYQSVRTLTRMPSGWIETCIAWAAIDNLSFQVTIPTQQTNPLLKKNMHQLVYEFCASLNRNQPPG